MTTIRELDGAEALARVPELADVLRDCVEGGASVGFMLPLAEGRPEAFWRQVAASVASGQRHLFVAEDAAGRLCGTLSLVVDMPDNQPHRAEVSKMLVHRRARRQGIAERLLKALEAKARELGRTTLVLDTVTGSDASRVYERLGWQRAGDIPRYALMPDGSTCATTYYYRHLDPALTIRSGRREDAEALAALIASFQRELTLDPSGQGAEPFLSSVSADAERRYLADPRFRYWIAETDAAELAAFIALRDERHVFHLFVDRRHHRHGLARRLWGHLFAHGGPASEERPYTVNASLNAVAVYRRFGFVEAGPVVRQHGIAFQPMRCT